MKTNSESVPRIEGLIEEGEAFRRLTATATPFLDAAQVLDAAQLHRTAARRHDRAGGSRVFHTGMSIAFLLTAFAGFAPTYYLKGLTHSPPLSPLLHVHGLVFTSWLVLLFTQTALVRAHRVDLHKRLGIAGAILAALMVPLGFMAAIAAARAGVTRAGLDPMTFMIGPVGSILMFAAFVGAGLWKRRQPEIHRRLILLATVSIITPAIARLPFVGFRPTLALGLSALFVVAAMIHDYLSARRRARANERSVHPIYIWGGLAIVLSGPVRFGLGHTAAWQSFAHFLVAHCGS